MDEILYLEADEEITSVVDKLKGLDAKSVSLVAPKGSTIVQSVVSLKLLKKQAEKLDRKIAIITSDEVGRNLASRVGLPVYADTKSAEPLEIAQEDVPDASEVVEIGADDEAAELPKDFEVHRYDQAKDRQERQEAVKPKEDIAPAKSEPKSEPAPDTAETKQEFTKRPIESAHVDNRAEMESARPIKAESKAPKISKPKKKTGWIIFGLAVAIIVVVVAADLLLARVKVDIAIPADELQKTVAVTVERDKTALDLETSTIPGTQVQKEEEFSDIFSATGEKDAGEKATGNLTFKNESGVNETIDAGATVASSSGLEFTLQTTITVPKATLNAEGDKVLGQASGAVEATAAGDGYNLAASTSYSVYGKPRISVSGGTSGGVTKKIRIVSNTDISEAQDKLQEKGKSGLIEAISANKADVIIPDAEKIEVVSFATTKNANDEASEFKATARVRITTLTYKTEDLKKVSLAQLEKTLKEGKGLLTTDGDSFDVKVSSSDINVGKVSLQVAVTTHTGPAVDLSNLSKSWRAKTLGQIRQEAGKIPEAQVKQVGVWPTYALPIAPILKDNIIINLEYSKK